MLSAAIILPDTAEMPSAISLLSIKGIEWNGIFHSGKKKIHTFDRSFIFSTIEIIPLINDLLIIADPNLCTLEYLSFAIRNGCHLFRSWQRGLYLGFFFLSFIYKGLKVG